MYCTDCKILPLSSKLQFYCQLYDVKDIQSTINQFTVFITSDSLQLFSQKMHNLPTFLSPVINNNNRSNYYITLHVENSAGLINIFMSNMIDIDVTPPHNSGGLLVAVNHASGHYLTTLTHGDPVCVWWNEILSVYFQPFIDKESDIIEYRLGIGSTPGGDDFYHYTTVKPVKTSQLYMIRLPSKLENSRKPLYFTVRAINAALLHSDLTSHQYYIKSTTNTKVSQVYDGKELYNDIDFQNYTTYISGHLHYGINCPLKYIEWSVERADGVITKNISQISVPSTITLHEVFSISSDQVILQNQETYRLVVQGRNSIPIFKYALGFLGIDYAGEVFTLRSNGTLVTTYGLQPGIVLHGNLSKTTRYQDSLSSITFRVSGFGDGSMEQQILFYEVALGTDPRYLHTRSNIVPFVNVGLNSTITLTNLSLISRNQPYFVTVRAHALSGAISEVTSNSIIPGYDSPIMSGMITQPMYQYSKTNLNVHWEPFQSDVPILYYQWAIANYTLNYSQLAALCRDLNSEELIQGFENVNLRTFFAATGLSLEHNQTYYVLVQAVDEAGKCSTVISESPTKIDTTPPIGRSTVIGPDESNIGRDHYVAYLEVGNDLTLKWENFTDPESPIDSFAVAFFELSSCSLNGFQTSDTVVDYTHVGLQNSFTFDHLNLKNNVSYIAKIKATNKAGLEGYIQSEPVVLDSHKLTSGTVKDGNDWTNDVVFQSNTDELSGVFSIALQQPYYNNKLSEIPCPEEVFFKLNESYSEWSNNPPSIIEGLVANSVRHKAQQIEVDTDGLNIVVKFDPGENKIVSGVYTYSNLPSLRDQNVITVSVQSIMGDSELIKHTVTSLLLLESSFADFLVDIDNESLYYTPPFIGLGLQLHHSFSDGSGYHQQKILMWSKSNLNFPNVESVSRNVSIDFTHPHQYAFHFTKEQLGLTYRRKVDLYIDDALYISMFGIANFSNQTKLILHVFNRKGFVPQCDAVCALDPPTVIAKFTSVSLPSLSGDACDYGQPFYSWGSPIVDFQVAVGTQPKLNDIKDYEVNNCYFKL